MLSPRKLGTKGLPMQTKATKELLERMPFRLVSTIYTNCEELQKVMLARISREKNNICASCFEMLDPYNSVKGQTKRTRSEDWHC